MYRTNQNLQVTTTLRTDHLYPQSQNQVHPSYSLREFLSICTSFFLASYFIPYILLPMHPTSVTMNAAIIRPVPYAPVLVPGSGRGQREPPGLRQSTVLWSSPGLMLGPNAGRHDVIAGSQKVAKRRTRQILYQVPIRRGSSTILPSSSSSPSSEPER